MLPRHKLSTILEGEKKKKKRQREREKEREKVKEEEIKMPKGSSIRICSFSPFFLLLSRVVVLHIVLCPICYRRHALLIICTHPSLTVFLSFSSLSLCLCPSIVCSHIHIDILLLVTATTTSRTLLVDFLVLFS